MAEQANPVPANHPSVVRISLRALIVRARTANLLAPLPAFLMGWIVWGVVPGQLIAVWLLLNTMPDLVSALLCTYLIRRPPPDDRLEYWHRWEIGLRTLQGFSWGTAAVVFHAPGPNAFTNDLSILVILLGTAAIATINMAPSLLTQSGFTLGILSVPMVAYLSFGDLPHLKFAVGIAIAIVLLLQFGYDACKQYQSGVRELVRSQQLSQKLAELSVTDHLTGIANRRRFDEALANEWARALRQSGLVALIMLDVDFFKKYNDRYGHQAGDECLTKVAEVLKRSARRAYELVARYGGEEFVVLQARCSLEEAAAVAEAVRSGVEGLSLPHADSPFGVVTVSVGVVVSAAERTATADTLLHAADAALYEAKHTGRNRVFCSSP